MKQLSIYLVIGIVMLLYGAINYYIGIRGWQALGNFIPVLNKRLYWAVFWLLVTSFLIARIGPRLLSAFNPKYFAIVGSYWIAAMFYLLLMLVLIDVIRLLNKWFNFIPASIHNNPQILFATGLVVLFIVLSILSYGTWNARNPRVSYYDLNVAKKTKSLDQLHLVMVSDIHLGTIMDNKRLQVMVKGINQLEPDVVLLAGDIVDENISPFVEQKMEETLKLLKSKYGTFAALGNHEYIGGHVEEIIQHLEKAQVQVLRDKYVKIADSFYIVGRDDLTGEHFDGGNKRKPLSILLADIDKSLPIILLDHQPRALAEAQEQGVDLQFSGHTHRGQLFPNHLITGRLFEVDWGYLKKENLHVIVSSGFGTWGPPIRTGSRSEIVDVIIRFQ